MSSCEFFILQSVQWDAHAADGAAAERLARAQREPRCTRKSRVHCCSTNLAQPSTRRPSERC